MKSLRMILAGTALLFASEAFADLAPLPPPDFGDCTAAKQKKNPADDCQECNNLYQEGCEKIWKDKGYTRACQVKPEYANDWREVWCKNPEAAKETPKEPVKEARTATETSKQGGCAVNPEGSTSWLLMLGLGFLVSRRTFSRRIKIPR
jgi:hypothetical protein